MSVLAYLTLGAVELPWLVLGLWWAATPTGRAKLARKLPKETVPETRLQRDTSLTMIALLFAVAAIPVAVFSKTAWATTLVDVLGIAFAGAVISWIAGNYTYLLTNILGGAGTLASITGLLVATLVVLQASLPVSAVAWATASLAYAALLSFSCVQCWQLHLGVDRLRVGAEPAAALNAPASAVGPTGTTVPPGSSESRNPDRDAGVRH